MFDIGFWEMLLIVILAMIVVGPERLPGAARTAGRWFGKARRFVEGVKADVEQEFDVTELKRMLHNQEVKINELTQKVANPDLLDKELETAISTVYSIEDESIEDESIGADEDRSAEPSKKEKDTDKKASGASLDADE